MSSNTTIAQLRLASQVVSASLGFPLFVGGLVGNVLNVLVFLTLGNYKHNASSLYILCKSFLDLIILVIGLASRVLSQAFQIDFTSSNRVWCKLRVAIFDICALHSLTCICLQTVDAFICSSKVVAWRQKSNVKTARCLIIGFFLLWICHEIPYVIFQDLISIRPGAASSCVATNSIYSQYRSYFAILGLYFFAPIALMSVFGFLTYRHLRMPHIDQNRKLPILVRQMTIMSLFQIAAVLVFIGPHACATVYFTSTQYVNKDAYRQAREQVAQFFFNIYAYGTYALRNDFEHKSLMSGKSSQTDED